MNIQDDIKRLAERKLRYAYIYVGGMEKKARLLYETPGKWGRFVFLCPITFRPTERHKDSGVDIVTFINDEL